MEMNLHCKTAARHCKRVAAKAGKAIGDELEREIHWRAVVEFRRENPRKTAEFLAAELGVSLRLSYYLLSGKMLLRMGQIGALGVRRSAGWINRVVVEPIAAARASRDKDTHDARADARQSALEQQLAAEQADLAAEMAGAGAADRRRRDRLFSIFGPLKARRRQNVGAL